MPTSSVESGRNINASLPSADAVDEPSTAVRTARKMLGFITGIGVSLPLSSD